MTHPFDGLQGSSGGGTFVRWLDEGQQVVGVVSNLDVVRDHFADIGDRNAAMHPQLTIDTIEGEKIVTCGQAQLRSKVIEAHQKDGILVGDNITITYTGIESLKGGKTMKCFLVSVTRPAAAVVIGDDEPF